MANNPFGQVPGGMAGIMKAAQQAERMMAEAKKTEDELGKVTVQGTSGGGLVTVRATGKADLIDIKIAKEVVNPEEIDALEDLIVVAVRDAVDKANAVRKERLESIMPAGMNIPGLF